MNKKLFTLFIAILIILISFSPYYAATDSESRANDILNEKYNQNTDERILIVYFSRNGENYNVGNVEVGNTAMIASYIKEYLKADSYEIVPVNKYPSSYDECTDVAKKEQEENARPQIESKIDNLNEYDTIFIGYPIWWGNTPMIINTFLEQNNLEGKNIIPFTTHEGSGDAGTFMELQNKLSNSKVNTNGLAIQGQRARTDEGKQDTINWLHDLGY